MKEKATDQEKKKENYFKTCDLVFGTLDWLFRTAETDESLRMYTDLNICLCIKMYTFRRTCKVQLLEIESLFTILGYSSLNLRCMSIFYP